MGVVSLGGVKRGKKLVRPSGGQEISKSLSIQVPAGCRTLTEVASIHRTSVTFLKIGMLDCREEAML